MKIVKFNQFINENVHDTPEEYIKVALMKIKTKLESMFKKPEDTEVKKIGDTEALDGVELQSSELSRYSKTQDSVKIKYSDAESMYDLLVSINLKEAVAEDETSDFSDDDIKKCFIKFKKYNLENFELIGEISKNIDIKDINDDFLVTLKIEMDEKFGGNEEELEIETD